MPARSAWGHAPSWPCTRGPGSASSCWPTPFRPAYRTGLPTALPISCSTGRALSGPVRAAGRGRQGNLCRPADGGHTRAAARCLRRPLRQRLSRRCGRRGRERWLGAQGRAERGSQLPDAPLRPRPVPDFSRSGNAGSAVFRSVRCRSPGKGNGRYRRIARRQWPRNTASISRVKPSACADPEMRAGRLASSLETCRRALYWRWSCGRRQPSPAHRQRARF
jgi:hypothetical protein